MNEIRSCNDTPKLEGDLSTYFDKLSRYLDRHEEREECEEREVLEAKPDAAERMVRLGCTGELADIGSIGLVVVRTSANGAELIEFLCPRCERLHESLPVR
jgi:hypothetical protein